MLDWAFYEDLQKLQPILLIFLQELIHVGGYVVDGRRTPMCPEEGDCGDEQFLDAAYVDEEVKIALFQMYSSKAPRPDGFPA